MKSHKIYKGIELFKEIEDNLTPYTRIECDGDVFEKGNLERNYLKKYKATVGYNFAYYLMDIKKDIDSFENKYSGIHTNSLLEKIDELSRVSLGFVWLASEKALKDLFLQLIKRQFISCDYKSFSIKYKAFPCIGKSINWLKIENNGEPGKKYLLNLAHQLIEAKLMERPKSDTELYNLMSKCFCTANGVQLNFTSSNKSHSTSIDIELIIKSLTRK